MYIAQRLFDFSIDSQNKYMRDIAKYDPLTAEEERELFIRYREHNDLSAREKLIKHNLKFTVSVAKQYANNKNIMLADLINEGNLGLIRAIDLYDYKQYNTKFISYAVYWIRRYMLYYLYKVSPILTFNIEYYKMLLKLKNIRENCNDEEEVQKRMIEYLRKKKKKENEIDKIINVSTDYINFSTPITGTNEEITVEDVISNYIPGNNEENILAKISDNLLIEKILNNMPDVEREFIEELYGLNGKEPKNYTKLADKYHVNIYTIKKIHQQILKNIKYRLMLFR